MSALDNDRNAQDVEDTLQLTHGMSLRDYFAGKALPIAAALFPDGAPCGWDTIAKVTYSIADAMLEARKA